MLLIKALLLSCSFALAKKHHEAIPSPYRNQDFDRPAPQVSDTSVSVLEDGLFHFGNNSLISDGVSCEGCKALLQVLKRFSVTDHAFVASGREVCRLIQPVLHATREEICLEGIAQHGPLLARALRSIKNVQKSEAATMLCNNFLHVCPVLKPKSKLKLPKPLKLDAQEMSTESGRGWYKVVHFSDLHIDPLYEVGTSGECDNPVLCCRNKTQWETSVAGPFGFPKRCDAPLLLEESMYRAINRVAPDAEYTIFTGDVVEREVWHTTPMTNIRRLDAAYSRMKKHFPHFAPAVGNHEASPTNWFPAQEMLNKKYNIEWLYGLLRSLWKDTQVGVMTSYHHRGHYMYQVRERRLRIIGINTNMYYYLNLWLYQDPVDADPDGQLKWLVRELQDAEWQGERVWIVGHMPMGDVDVVPHSSAIFNDIMTRYNRTVTAMFFGHTHMDQYQINYAAGRYRTADTALVMSFIAPSLTPSNGFPAFRVYTVDEDSHTVLDATTYFANMTDPAYQVDPMWEELYSIKTEYPEAFQPDSGGDDDSNNNTTTTTTGGGEDGKQDISKVPVTAARFHDLSEKLESDPDLFDIYWKNKHTGSNDIDSCNDACRRKEICLMRGGRAEDNCAGKLPGAKLGRRHKRGVDEDSSHSEVNHCGSSVLLDALGTLFDPEWQAKLRKLVSSLRAAKKSSHADSLVQ
ncbi:hypothetical protein E4U55_003762 [Claviceps digitariae]|nr:hypothetical protein E4U55_003762 [Claviceps digitariae]